MITKIDREWLQKPNTPFPFIAIIDQSTVKTALILNAVDPSIGGVLISGPKGTGKSLLVKSFSEILPDIDYVKGCNFGCSMSDPANMCSDCQAKNKSGIGLETESRAMKIIQVPLSVTDDMLIGSVDIEKVLEDGVKALRPGLLAKANNNILYIDEVNLLPDHITDAILDSAASGWNNVEREGVSIQHPSRFILIGTMNPEEGDLRPQILDRFGLFAETKSLEDVDQRLKAIEMNERFSTEPFLFKSLYADEIEVLRRKVSEAKKSLRYIEVPDEILHVVSETCSRLRVDGFRPDIVAVKAAKALAAFNSRYIVSFEDVNTCLNLALGHRTRRSGLVSPPTPTEIAATLNKVRSPLRIHLGSTASRIYRVVVFPRNLLKVLIKQINRLLFVEAITSLILILLFILTLDTFRLMIHPEVASLNVIFLECLIGSAIFWFVSHIIKRKVNQIELDHSYMEKTILEVEDNLQTKEGSGGTSKGITTVKHKNQKEDESSTSFGTKIFGSMKNLTRKPIEARERSLVKLTVGKGETCGRRAKGQSSSSRGRYAWYQTPKGKPKDIALVPTIQAAAIHQKGRENLIPRTLIKPEDIRIKVREYYAPFTLVLLIDMSLSMANSMENIIETIYSFHRDVYRRKDRVALIVFKGIKSHIIQQPTRNLDLVVEKLRKVGASDFTPMATGLLQSLKILKQERIINKDSIPNVIVVSDGIVNVPLDVPLSPLTRRKYLSEAQADALDVAFLMSKEKIKVHIVNTNHSEIDAKSFPVTNFGNRIRFTPTQFMMELARLTGGEYKGLTSASED